MTSIDEDLQRIHTELKFLLTCDVTPETSSRATKLCQEVQVMNARLGNTDRERSIRHLLTTSQSSINARYNAPAAALPSARPPSVLPTSGHLSSTIRLCDDMARALRTRANPEAIRDLITSAEVRRDEILQRLVDSAGGPANPEPLLAILDRLNDCIDVASRYVQNSSTPAARPSTQPPSNPPREVAPATQARPASNRRGSRNPSPMQAQQLAAQQTQQQTLQCQQTGMRPDGQRRSSPPLSQSRQLPTVGVHGAPTPQLPYTAEPLLVAPDGITPSGVTQGPAAAPRGFGLGSATVAAPPPAAPAPPQAPPLHPSPMHHRVPSPQHQQQQQQQQQQQAGHLVQQPRRLSAVVRPSGPAGPAAAGAAVPAACTTGPCGAAPTATAAPAAPSSHPTGPTAAVPAQAPPPGALGTSGHSGPPPPHPPRPTPSHHTVVVVATPFSGAPGAAAPTAPYAAPQAALPGSGPTPPPLHGRPAGGFDGAAGWGRGAGPPGAGVMVLADSGGRDGDVAKPRSALAPPVGFLNATGHNNCFLNVVIQTLWHCRRFRSAFKRAHGTAHRHGASTCRASTATDFLGAPPERLGAAAAGAPTNPPTPPCLMCAMDVIFTNLRYGDSDIDATVLRGALAAAFPPNVFPIAATADAAEAMEAILLSVCRAFGARPGGTAVSARGAVLAPQAGCADGAPHAGGAGGAVVAAPAGMAVWAKAAAPLPDAPMAATATACSPTTASSAGASPTHAAVVTAATAAASGAHPVDTAPHETYEAAYRGSPSADYVSAALLPRGAADAATPPEALCGLAAARAALAALTAAVDAAEVAGLDAIPPAVAADLCGLVAAAARSPTVGLVTAQPAAAQRARADAPHAPNALALALPRGGAALPLPPLRIPLALAAAGAGAPAGAAADAGRAPAGADGGADVDACGAAAGQRALAGTGGSGALVGTGTFHDIADLTDDDFVSEGDDDDDDDDEGGGAVGFRTVGWGAAARVTARAAHPRGHPDPAAAAAVPPLGGRGVDGGACGGAEGAMVEPPPRVPLQHAAVAPTHPSGKPPVTSAGAGPPLPSGAPAPSVTAPIAVAAEIAPTDPPCGAVAPCACPAHACFGSSLTADVGDPSAFMLADSPAPPTPPAPGIVSARSAPKGPCECGFFYATGVPSVPTDLNAMSDFMHVIPSSQLRACADGKGGRPRCLPRALTHVSVACPTCERQTFVRKYAPDDASLPLVLTLQILWDTPNATKDDVAAVAIGLPLGIDLRKAFGGSTRLGAPAHSDQYPVTNAILDVTAVPTSMRDMRSPGAAGERQRGSITKPSRPIGGDAAMQRSGSMRSSRFMRPMDASIGPSHPRVGAMAAAGFNVATPTASLERGATWSPSSSSIGTSRFLRGMIAYSLSHYVAFFTAEPRYNGDLADSIVSTRAPPGTRSPVGRGDVWWKLDDTSVRPLSAPEDAPDVAYAKVVKELIDGRYQPILVLYE